MADLRGVLETAFRAGLDEVRGGPAVETALHTGFGRGAAEVEVLAAGKAAPPMLAAAASFLGTRLTQGFAAAKEAGGPAPARCEVVLTGHPVPDLRSCAAGRQWLGRAERCPPDRDLLVLLSGGASALLSCPVAGLEPEDLRIVTDLLLRAGADIESLNAVRKHLGAVGGGRTLQVCGSACVEVLAISDVPDDRLDLLASGPFCADPHTYQDALAVLERFAVAHAVPQRVREVLDAGARGERPETLKTGDPSLGRVRHRIVASLGQALRASEAAARDRGYAVQAWPHRLRGEARVNAVSLARALRAAPRRTCIVAGGEPTVTVRGSGTGGRAQELALALAVELEGAVGLGALVAATDGSDGPTDAAGAWIDGGTVARGRRVGAEAQAALEANDSHTFFTAEGGLLRTGPTGTNVNDLVLLGTV